ncbi:MAG: hypothetical protein P4M01_03615 [Acidobacteriota bacterium]|nr:hypothetical protein [Acidobacteriota bacterium]
MHSFSFPSLAIVRQPVRLLTVFLLVLVVLMALCAGLHTVSDSDMGWHLATGRYVVQHLAVPRTDVLTFTSAGQPWAYPPFAGALFYLVYRAAGYAGLSWLCALASAVAIGYLVRRGSPISALLAMFAVQSVAARTTPRADMFSTLFFVFVFGELWAYQRGRSHRLWTVPLTLFLWVNLHPGFIAGLGCCAAYLLLELFEFAFSARRAAALQRLRKALPYLAGAALATLLNPWGIGVYRVAAVLSGVRAPAGGQINSSSFIAEYQGVPLGGYLLKQLIDLRHMENGFTWLLLIAVLLIGVALWKRQPGAAVLLGVALYGGLSHARYMALFTIVVATVGADVLRLLRAPRDKSAAFPALPAPFAVAALAVLCAVAMLHIADYATSRTYVVFGSDWRFGAGESYWLPERAAAFLEREHLPGNIFEEYALGGYEAFRLGPAYPDFLDGRSDRLRPDLVAEQRKLYTANPDSQLWQAAADHWNLNVVLLATSGFRSLQKLSPAAFCGSANWRAVYMDDSAMVFVRNLPQNQPWIDRLQINCATQPLTLSSSASRTEQYDFYLNSGALLQSLRRPEEAEQSLLRASALFPADPNAHLLLAGVYLQRRQAAAAEQEFRRSLALNENGGTWFSLGQLYASERRLPEATDAVQRAASMTADPCDMYLYLAELQLSQNQPQAALSSLHNAEHSSPYRNGGESLVPELYARLAEDRSESARQSGDLAGAITYQSDAVNLTPTNARRWGRLAGLYEAAGQMNQAARARRMVDQLSPISSSHLQ